MNSPYQTLKFPLNVFAHSLYLQEGRTEYLQFGLFEPGIQTMYLAQQQAMDTLLHHLPPLPCRVLEMGVNAATMRKHLLHLGYQLQHQHETNQYDVLLCHENASTLHGLAFFNEAYQALTEKGQLIILDCFSLARTADANETTPPMLPYTLTHLQRCGFSLNTQLDLTAAALPSLNYWLQALETHHANLIDALALSDAELAKLQTRLRQQQQQFTEQQQTFTLLVAEKSTAPRWRVTPVTAKEAPAVRQLFEQVFAPQRMSEAFWHWKYGQGRGLGIAAWTQAGQMVGHYGGIMRKIRYFGEPKTAVQITDVMVSTQERGVLTKRGVFFLVTANFLEDYIGYGTPTWLGYGFPSARHLRLAAKQGLYDAVEQLLELRYPAATRIHPLLWSRIRHVRLACTRDIRHINRLWRHMARDLSQHLVGLRNWRYIAHRYLAHPDKTYEVLIITQRLTGIPLALVVLYRDETQCKWMDYVGSLAMLPLALRQVQQMAARWQLPEVQIWMTRNCAGYFPQQDAEQNAVTQIELEIQIPHNIWSQGIDSAEIRDKWWLMMGDTDFL